MVLLCAAKPTQKGVAMRAWDHGALSKLVQHRGWMSAEPQFHRRCIARATTLVPTAIP